MTEVDLGRGCQAVVYGGRNEEEALGGTLHVLTLTHTTDTSRTAVWTWTQLRLSGETKVSPVGFATGPCSGTLTVRSWSYDNRPYNPGGTAAFSPLRLRHP